MDNFTNYKGQVAEWSAHFDKAFSSATSCFYDCKSLTIDETKNTIKNGVTNSSPDYQKVLLKE